MDDAEAEEAVGGSSPVTPPSTDTSGTPTPNDDDSPDAASCEPNPEAKIEEHVTPCDDTKERLPQEPALPVCSGNDGRPCRRSKQRGRSARVPGHRHGFHSDG
ncbi:unnamed protein product [Ixodes hexagonus]